MESIAFLWCFTSATIAEHELFDDAEEELDDDTELSTLLDCRRALLHCLRRFHPGGLLGGCVCR